MTRAVLALMLLTLLALGGWVLWTQLPGASLLTAAGEWVDGWQIAHRLWPLALLGVLPGLLAGWLMAVVWRGAEKIDAEAERDDLKKRLASAEERAQEAVASREQAAETLRERAEQRYEKASKIMAEAQNIRHRASEAVSHAQQQAADAEQRRQNATAMAERLKRRRHRAAG